jgi:hypothetical protein
VKRRQKWSSHDWSLLILVSGATLLPLVICLGAFGRAFYLAVVTKEDHAISDSATQLLTSLGSALVGSAASFIAGVQVGKNEKKQKQTEEQETEQDV